MTDTSTPIHHHHHDCGNLFGCGDEKGTSIIREDIKDAAFDNRASDRLLHMDEVDQELCWTFGHDRHYHTFDPNDRWPRRMWTRTGR